MPTKPVPITGSVLAWAITDAGRSRAQVAAEVGVDPGVVLAWEQERDRPSTGQFNKLCGLLKRPPSFFFLARPPSTAPVAPSFRTHKGTAKDREPTPQEVTGLQLARRLQSVTAWVYERTERTVQLPRLTVQTDPEEAGSRLREWLRWGTDDVVGASISDAKVTFAMRSAIQDCGVIALNLTLGEDGARGFSLPHRRAPLLAVNTSDHHRARLFSLVHELAHLTLGDNSLCTTSQAGGVEPWCNRTAASVLMPTEPFWNYVQSKFPNEEIATTAQVSTIRNYWHTSLRAVAIRLEHLGLAKEGLYDLVDREAEAKKKPGGRPQPDKPQHLPRVRLQQYGRGYVTALMEAEEEGILPQAEVLSLLKLSRSEYAQIQEYANSGDEG